MNLRELRAAHPHLFYKQDWFEGEAFMEVPLGQRIGEVFDGWLKAPDDPEVQCLPLAVQLADYYVRHPRWWDFYYWCDDTDSHGQRIYLGSNGKGLEIHRHIHLTDRFRVPVFEWLR